MRHLPTIYWLLVRGLMGIACLHMVGCVAPKMETNTTETFSGVKITGTAIINEEGVALSMQITNHGDKTIRYYDFGFYDDAPTGSEHFHMVTTGFSTSCYLKVKSSAGQLAEFTQLGKSVIDPKFRVDNRHISLNLPPGGTNKWVIPLSKYYTFKPGKYTADFSMEVYHYDPELSPPPSYKIIAAPQIQFDIH